MAIFPGNAEKYSNVLKTDTLEFAQDIKEVNYSEIPVIDRDSAILLGNREMGSIPEYVSQFEVSNLYSQINYQGTPVRVSPLGYADLFKWFTNREGGIPAYALVNMTTQDAEIVRLEDSPIYYSQSEPLVRNIDRLSQYKYTFMVLGIILLLSPMIPGLGQEILGSRIWLKLGPFSFQPGEIAKICIVIFLASYLAQNREMLSIFTVRVVLRGLDARCAVNLRVVSHQVSCERTLRIFARVSAIVCLHAVGQHDAIVCGDGAAFGARFLIERMVVAGVALILVGHKHHNVGEVRYKRREHERERERGIGETFA